MKETYSPRDALKQVLHVNDDVVFIRPYTKKLGVGTVIKVSSKTVMIKYSLDLTPDRETKEILCRRDAGHVVRVTQQVQIAKEENPEEYI